MPYLWWFTQISKSHKFTVVFFPIYSLSCVAFDVAAPLCRCNNSLSQKMAQDHHVINEYSSTSLALQEDTTWTYIWKSTQDKENASVPTQEERYLQFPTPCSFFGGSYPRDEKKTPQNKPVAWIQPIRLPHSSSPLLLSIFHRIIKC